MRTYDLSEQDVQEIADRAALTALAKAGVIKAQISTNDAYKRYGRKRVTEWRKLGLVKPIKQGSIIYWQVTELEKASLKNLL